LGFEDADRTGAIFFFLAGLAAAILDALARLEAAAFAFAIGYP
jgi:hypothetical protein